MATPTERLAERSTSELEARMLVAVLDDDKSRCVEMGRSLRQAMHGVTVEFFDNAPDMIAWLARHVDEVALLSLSHDLGPSRFRDGMLFDPGTGRDVTDFLVEMDRQFPVVVHTKGGPGGKSMLAMLEHSKWPFARVDPTDGLDWIESDWTPCVIDMLSKR